MRNVELSLESGDDLDVRTFNVLEAMSAAFQIDVTARSHDDAIDLAALVGRPASFTIHGELGDRVWTGVCAHAAQSGVEPEGLSTYTVKVVPAMWLLTQRSGHRLFQNLSVPEIAEKILGELSVPFEARLSGTHPRYAVRTQYGETDFDFVRRLLAEDGISFFFDTADPKETKVVLADAPQTGAPQPRTPIPFLADGSLARAEEHVSDVQIGARVVPARSTVGDHDFRRPRYTLAGSHATEGANGSKLEDYRWAPGHALAESSGAGEPVADARGTYRHDDVQSQTRARIQGEAQRAAQRRIEFSTTRSDLAPGAVFSIEGHPHPEVSGKKLLVTQAQINGDVGANSWHAGGCAVPADAPYRPAALLGKPSTSSQRDGCGPFTPLDRVTKPRIHGVQTAIVTGPPGEEVHTDEHGRVTVQFPWDREGRFDEKSSPFLRVSQEWAGAGYGVHAVPRVGHEVLVAYHDGNPDQPVVVGRVHDAAAPTPYAVPEHAFRTSIMTSTAAGPNEITFDDTAGHELFYVQAAGELQKIVGADELETTTGNRTVHAEGDLVISSGGTITFHAGDDIVLKGGPHVHVNPSASPPPAKKPRPLKAQTPSKTPSTAAGLNGELAGMNPGSMPESDYTAKLRKGLAEQYQHDAEILGAKYHLPPALILALMSRESGFGTLLVDGWGDHHHGFGILQVDNRSHTPVGGPTSMEHMEQAMGIFESGLASVKAAHPSWTSDQQLAGAVAAYNGGPNNVQTQPTNPSSWAQMDQGTTGDNYSRDVWAQAQWYSNNLKW